MWNLINKQIIVGISGSIAAYKSAELVRLLKKQGALVQVVMTDNASHFITPMTLQALSALPVRTEIMDGEAELHMGHIELARWADAIIIAPASANIMASLAHGESKDLLTTLCLATPAQVFIAPAMNQQMWAHESTQHNVNLLNQHSYQLLGPASGEQACGDVGSGRMLEPQELVQALDASFSHAALAGKKVVITAGPTREALDPVRFLSNHSTGKMGFALAQAAQEAGADVHLIAGPVNLETPQRVQRVDVVTAQEMFAASKAECSDDGKSADIFIATAAVADYRPAHCSDQKIKKTENASELVLTLDRNPDILAHIAQDASIFAVGFAAETQNVIEYGRSKLERKNLDMIAINDVSDKNIGFGSNDNALVVIDKSGEATALEKMSKIKLARQLIALIVEKL